LAEALAHRRRGCTRRIGPIDSFFLLLHWLRPGSSIEQIAVGFDTHKQALYKRIREVIELAHDDRVNR
jgi:transposase-like protein